MRFAPICASSLLLLVVGGLAGAGCTGVVAPEPPPEGIGSSGGMSSGSSGGAGGSGSGVTPASDGGQGDPGPDGATPPPPTCAPGVVCQAGEACASAGGPNACAESCTCDATGHFQCIEECADASTPTGCEQGAACTANSGCGGGSTGGCSFSCGCDPTGHLQCTTSCPPPIDAGCVQNVLCVMGDHWDRTQCRCVPDACVSQVGGPCGGFVANPCQCAPGLACVTGGVVADVAGTCEAQSCCPVAWDMYSCTGANGRAGLNCHNPALGCASSSTCGGGCDSQVTGRCPVCDPIPCPSGDTFDSTQCKCVAPSCKTAADCTGPLPLVCEVCADGGTGCAHWSCVAGQCQMAFCQ